MKHWLQPHPALRWLGLLALLLGTLAAGSPARAQTITQIIDSSGDGAYFATALQTRTAQRHLFHRR